MVKKEVMRVMSERQIEVGHARKSADVLMKAFDDAGARVARGSCSALKLINGTRRENKSTGRGGKDGFSDASVTYSRIEWTQTNQIRLGATHNTGRHGG